MEAVLISGAQGLPRREHLPSFQGYGEGNPERIRRYRGSVDGGSNPAMTGRPRSCEARRQRFYSDAGSVQTTSFIPQPEVVPVPPLGRTVKRGGIRVRMNVSGMIFETLEGTLSRFPNTLLGDPQKRNNFFDPRKKEYFFDRNRFAFDAILFYYQSNGKLLRPGEIDIKTFVNELEFFEMGDNILNRFRAVVDGDQNDPMPENPIQRKLWQVLEYPDSSMPARCIAVWSVCVILLSIVLFCIETLPTFRDARTDPNSSLNRIEIFVITWFTLEYLVRLLTAPRKWAFLRSFLNLIDLMAILPYFVTLGIGNQETERKGASLPAFFRILRLVRVMRIFKLSRHNRGLKVLGLTLKASTRELLLLAFFLAMGVIIFSSAVYYAESANFLSIPEAFWWSVVTMTTVGYGDKTPTSGWGKVIGSLCAVAGVLTLALPVPVIVSNFSYYYKQDRERLSAGPPEAIPAKPSVEQNEV